MPCLFTVERGTGSTPKGCRGKIIISDSGAFGEIKLLRVLERSTYRSLDYFQKLNSRYLYRLHFADYRFRISLSSILSRYINHYCSSFVRYHSEAVSLIRKPMTPQIALIACKRSSGRKRSYHGERSNSRMYQLWSMGLKPAVEGPLSTNSRYLGSMQRRRIETWWNRDDIKYTW